MVAVVDSNDRRQLVLHALRSPRGRYSAERASQLSGIPSRTIYDWQRTEVLLPDFDNARPMAWSYRDLVYLRLLAWLRQAGMERPRASLLVGAIRWTLARGDRIETVRSDGRIVLVDEEFVNRFDGENVFPLEDVVHMMDEFDLLDPIREVGNRPLWGPDLITPSLRTYISPWVMAGEPCVQETRIPTSSLYALRLERDLPVARVVELYPGLDAEAVEDAWQLEDRLRRVA